MSPSLVVVAAKRSQYQKYVRDQHDPRALELLARHDPVVANWRRADTLHRRTYDAVLDALDHLGAKVIVPSKPHAEFDVSGAALVVTVGGDGTFLAASHSVGSEPVLGINSAPEFSVGYFCAPHRGSLRKHLDDALSGRLRRLQMTRMRVEVNGRLTSSRVLNEALYSHRVPAATSRYILQWGRKKEEQRSSGFWIGPAAGSTGAQRSAGGRVLPMGSKKLQLVVREPYCPPGLRIGLRQMLVSQAQSISVRSKMDDAALFLDGPYKRIDLHLGDVVRFSASTQPLMALGIRQPRMTRRD